MFEKMIHNTEELNAMAVHLRLSQNFSELKSLAAKWLVPEDHIQDFISGKRAQLAEIPLEEKEYSSAVEKLREEMWLLKDQMFTDIVSRYLIQKAEENPAFSMQVLQKHKTIQKCMNYIMEQAYSIAQKEHEKRVNGKQPVTGRQQNVALGISEIQVYQWAEDYYALDDAKQEADKKEKEFSVRMAIGKNSYQNPVAICSEKNRYLYDMDFKETPFYFGDYKHRGNRWIRGETHSNNYWYYYYSYVDNSSGAVYARTIPDLSKKELKMTGLPEILKGKSYFQPRDYLRSLRKAPILEQLVKAKLKTLSYEVLENPLKISSFQDHGALHLRLGISKDALKRLRKNDGDMKYLTWLQEENRSPHYLDDELIFWYMENHIEPNELNFIHTKMSYVQIRNYLIRQKGKRKDSISQVLTTWKDYISMAKRVKMNINDEIVYRATKLYKRHNDLIKYIEDNQLSVTAGELADKYPNINSVLSGLREKYEYSDETFTILAPRCIEDILKEGQALHHCIDKKTEYLERINEQETYILFLRNTKQPDTPYYTLEVEPGGVIRQKRTEYDRQNKDIEAASAFLREWQLEIQKRITENDRELANRSRQLRMESYAEMRKKKVKINGGLFQGKYLADVLEADLMEMPDTLQQAA